MPGQEELGQACGLLRLNSGFAGLQAAASEGGRGEVGSVVCQRYGLVPFLPCRSADTADVRTVQ